MELNKRQCRRNGDCAMKKSGSSLMSAIERYAFGAVKLREEIQRHRQEGTERWGNGNTDGVWV